MALLWVVTTSLFLTSALFFSHGQHRVSTQLEGGALNLVFHHDGELADHHHNGSSGTDDDSSTPATPHDNSDGHSKNSGDHVASLSTAIATSPAPTAYVVTKFLPVISVPSIFDVLTQVSSFEAPQILFGSVEGIPISALGLRTIVLLI